MKNAVYVVAAVAVVGFLAFAVGAPRLREHVAQVKLAGVRNTARSRLGSMLRVQPQTTGEGV